MRKIYYTFSEDSLFVEDLTIENYLNCKTADVFFYDKQGRTRNKEEMIQLIVEDINRADIECRSALKADGITGRGAKGRFETGNINAKKLINNMETVYLLYLLCGSMEKTAVALGVCRQTVSKIVRQYKEYSERI